MASILVVEDERDVSSFIEEALTQEGHKIKIEENGTRALDLILNNNYDLVVLDVALPGMDGFEVLRKMRDVKKTPVLMLTARRRVEDRVQGLETGADDYLLKPFELSEFLARVMAILRRSDLAKVNLEYADLTLDRMTRKVKRGSRTLFLSNTEFALLELFCNQPETPISKKEILQKIWNDDVTRDPNLVEVYIGYLRTKLEVGGAPRLLQTVRGKGYRLSLQSNET